MVNYDEWIKTVPQRRLQEMSLWKVEAYRLGLFAADVSWYDVTKLMQDKRTLDLSDQLYRAVGSISANIAEGYSKSTGKDRARFYEYALGSARESRDWYYKARHILGEEVTHHRSEFHDANHSPVDYDGAAAADSGYNSRSLARLTKLTSIIF